KNAKKELHIKQASHGYQEPIKCSIFVNGCEVGDDILKKNGISNKILMISNDLSIVQFCKKSHVCMEQCTKARVNCTLLILDGNICSNYKMLHNTLYKIEKRHTDGIQSIKTSHAFREVLAELVQNTRKVIKSQKKLVKDLYDRLEQKFEAKEENISKPLTKIIYNVIEEVKNKEHEDIPNIILKELVRIQRLLWSQCNNKYVGYIDFDENAELEAFSEQCLHDVQIHVNDHKQTENKDKKDHEHALATQMFTLSIQFSFTWLPSLNVWQFIHVNQFVMVQVKTEDTLKALIGSQQPG
ncbi:3891_t:CDS:2, partial [Acaulospora morrowiae]